MAERITKLTERARGEPRKSIYPWDEWSDGSIWRITRGTDFTCLPKNMRAIIVTQGWRRNLDVRSQVMGDVVEFQMTPRNAG